jgi:hypothetical protein
MRHTPSALSFTLILALALTFAGCAHYRLGPGNTPAYHTIYFAPVVNHSFAPQINTYVSDALFRAFAQGGGMAVAGQNDGAEVVLHVTVTDFKKMIGATQSTDTGEARSLVMALKATATLSDPAGKQIYTGNFEVQQEYYADSGLVRAEQEALPQLADLLGQKIYRAVVSKW